MKIIIRADGGKSIGMGHIMRTSVLADSLKLHCKVVYASINKPDYENGISYVRQKGYDVILLDEINWIEQLCEQEADCLITDNYQVDEYYFEQTKKYFKYTGYIDDMDHIPFYNMDFIINQNIYASDLVYNTNSNTNLFLGTKYVMLRDEFRNITKKHINKDISNIMITTGGTDPNKDTIRILNDLVKYDLDTTIHVVIGNSFSIKCIEQIKEISEHNSCIKLYFNANMSELMQIADVAIAGCGSTLYELSACTTPTIGIVIADNQKMVANKFEQEGLIIRLDNTDIYSCIEKLTYKKRIDMSKRCERVVNVNGSNELADAILAIINHNN